MLRRFFLLALVAAGCRTTTASGLLSESSTIALPESVGARVAFSPDGDHAVVLGPQLLYTYDLTDRDMVWQEEVAPGPRAVAFSPGGRYLALLEAEGEAAVRARVETAGDGAVRVRIFDLRDPGPHQVFRFSSNTLSPKRPFELAGRLFSVSDDGRYLAVGSEVLGEQVDVYSIETGARVFHDESAEGGFVVSVAFEPLTHRLAAYASGARVWVMDAAGDSFAVVQSFPMAVWPKWTSQGLGFGSDQGLVLWSSGAPRLSLAPATAYSLDPAPRGPFTVASLAGASPKWSFSDDGTWVAVWDELGFRLHRTGDGAQIFEHAGRPVEAARWAPAHFRTFLSGGGYEDVELPDGRLVRSLALGSLGELSKEESTRHEILGPSGDWYDLDRHDVEHFLLNLE